MERFRQPRKKLCNCCPYGYHIDVDFVRFIETFAKCDNKGKHSSKRQRNYRRRQSQTIGSLLGIHSKSIDEIIIKSGDSPVRASPDVQKSFQKAVNDFEEILVQSSTVSKRPTSSNYSSNSSTLSSTYLNTSASQIDFNDIKEDSMTDYCTYNGSHAREISLSEATTEMPLEMVTKTPFKINTIWDLPDVEKCTTLCLERKNKLEKQGKLISDLESRILFLEAEQIRTISRLEQEKQQTLASYSTTFDKECWNNRITEENERRKNEEKKDGSSSIEKNKPEVKEIGVNCSVIMRDVGTVHCLPRTNDASVNTSLSTRDVQIMTDTTEEEKIKEKEPYIPKSTLTLNQILQPKQQILTKISQVSTAMQTMVNQQDASLQVGSLNCINAAVMAKPKVYDMCIMTKPNTKDTASSDCIVNHIYCEKCNVEKQSTATSTNTLSVSDNTKLENNLSYEMHSQKVSVKRYSKFTDTNDFVKSSKNCATQTVPLLTLDNVEATTKKELVQDASAEYSHYNQNVFCLKCEENAKKTLDKKTDKNLSHISKIPRPKVNSNGLSSDKRRTFVRQDTYTKYPDDTNSLGSDHRPISTFIPSSVSICRLENMNPETTNSCNTSNKIDSNTLHKDFNDDGLYFQPILESKLKSEPSETMKAAMKVLNDSLQKNPISKPSFSNLKNSIAIIQDEWFKVSSDKDSDARVVEDYLETFEEISTGLLEYIINMRDTNGNTAMHYAISYGNFEIVSILLNSKICNINALNEAGYTCTMVAAISQTKGEAHLAVLKRLFQMADVNVKARKHGQTMLMLATSHGKIDIVRLLLECGADINIQDNDGSTALMCAAEHGYVDIVTLLASHKDCNISMKDNDGYTALSIAINAGHPDVGIALYAKQHFSAAPSPVTLKEKRSRSANPVLVGHRTPTPQNVKYVPTKYVDMFDPVTFSRSTFN